VKDTLPKVGDKEVGWTVAAGQSACSIVYSSLNDPQRTKKNSSKLSVPRALHAPRWNKQQAAAEVAEVAAGEAAADVEAVAAAETEMAGAAEDVVVGVEEEGEEVVGIEGKAGAMAQRPQAGTTHRPGRSGNVPWSLMVGLMSGCAARVRRQSLRPQKRPKWREPNHNAGGRAEEMMCSICTYLYRM
jgi:hypothetical protein